MGPFITETGEGDAGTHGDDSLSKRPSRVTRPGAPGHRLWPAVPEDRKPVRSVCQAPGVLRLQSPWQKTHADLSGGAARVLSNVPLGVDVL